MNTSTHFHEMKRLVTGKVASVDAWQKLWKSYDPNNKSGIYDKKKSVQMVVDYLEAMYHGRQDKFKTNELWKVVDPKGGKKISWDNWFGAIVQPLIDLADASSESSSSESESSSDDEEEVKRRAMAKQAKIRALLKQRRSESVLAEAKRAEAKLLAASTVDKKEEDDEEEEISPSPSENEIQEEEEEPKPKNKGRGLSMATDSKHLSFPPRPRKEEIPDHLRVPSFEELTRQASNSDANYDSDMANMISRSSTYDGNQFVDLVGLAKATRTITLRISTAKFIHLGSFFLTIMLVQNGIEYPVARTDLVRRLTKTPEFEKVLFELRVPAEARIEDVGMFVSVCVAMPQGNKEGIPGGAYNMAATVFKFQNNGKEMAVGYGIGGNVYPLMHEKLEDQVPGLWELVREGMTEKQKRKRKIGFINQHVEVYESLPDTRGELGGPLEATAKPTMASVTALRMRVNSLKLTTHDDDYHDEDDVGTFPEWTERQLSVRVSHDMPLTTDSDDEDAMLSKPVSRRPSFPLNLPGMEKRVTATAENTENVFFSGNAYYTESSPSVDIKNPRKKKGSPHDMETIYHRDFVWDKEFEISRFAPLDPTASASQVQTLKVELLLEAQDGHEPEVLSTMRVPLTTLDPLYTYNWILTFPELSSRERGRDVDMHAVRPDGHLNVELTMQTSSTAMHSFRLINSELVTLKIDLKRLTKLPDIIDDVCFVVYCALDPLSNDPRGSLTRYQSKIALGRGHWPPIPMTLVDPRSQSTAPVTPREGEDEVSQEAQLRKRYTQFTKGCQSDIRMVKTGFFTREEYESGLGLSVEVVAWNETLQDPDCVLIVELFSRKSTVQCGVRRPLVVKDDEEEIEDLSDREWKQLKDAQKARSHREIIQNNRPAVQGHFRVPASSFMLQDTDMQKISLTLEPIKTIRYENHKMRETAFRESTLRFDVHVIRPEEILRNLEEQKMNESVKRKMKEAARAAKMKIKKCQEAKEKKMELFKAMELSEHFEEQVANLREMTKFVTKFRKQKRVLAKQNESVADHIEMLTKLNHTILHDKKRLYTLNREELRLVLNQCLSQLKHERKRVKDLKQSVHDNAKKLRRVEAVKEELARYKTANTEAKAFLHKNKSQALDIASKRKKMSSQEARINRLEAVVQAAMGGKQNVSGMMELALGPVRREYAPKLASLEKKRAGLVKVLQAKKDKNLTPDGGDDPNQEIKTKLLDEQDEYYIQLADRQRVENALCVALEGVARPQHGNTKLSVIRRREAQIQILRKKLAKLHRLREENEQLRTCMYEVCITGDKDTPELEELVRVSNRPKANAGTPSEWQWRMRFQEKLELVQALEREMNDVEANHEHLVAKLQKDLSARDMTSAMTPRGGVSRPVDALESFRRPVRRAPKKAEPQLTAKKQLGDLDLRRGSLHTQHERMTQLKKQSRPGSLMNSEHMSTRQSARRTTRRRSSRKQNFM